MAVTTLSLHPDLSTLTSLECRCLMAEKLISRPVVTLGQCAADPKQVGQASKRKRDRVVAHCLPAIQHAQAFVLTENFPLAPHWPPGRPHMNGNIGRITGARSIVYAFLRVSSFQ